MKVASDISVANHAHKPPNRRKQMQNPRHIIEAIDLLVATKTRKPSLWWVKPLDIVLTVAYLGAFGWLILNVVKWL